MSEKVLNKFYFYATTLLTYSVVPPDVTVMTTGQPAFVVEAVIENPYLSTKHGQTARLLPGISAEARIVTDRSTAMQMVLRKLDFIN